MRKSQHQDAFYDWGLILLETSDRIMKYLLMYEAETFISLTLQLRTVPWAITPLTSGVCFYDVGKRPSERKTKQYISLTFKVNIY